MVDKTFSFLLCLREVNSLRYILKNIINNKIGSVIFVIINHCNVFSIILFYRKLYYWTICG
ncbi:protein of unknown function [Clostridium beijerinckii]|nr:protein of unknown function [Clostridium beijerinckii]